MSTTSHNQRPKSLVGRSSGIRQAAHLKPEDLQRLKEDLEILRKLRGQILEGHHPFYSPSFKTRIGTGNTQNPTVTSEPAKGPSRSPSCSSSAVGYALSNPASIAQTSSSLLDRVSVVNGHGEEVTFSRAKLGQKEPQRHGTDQGPSPSTLAARLEPLASNVQLQLPERIEHINAEGSRRSLALHTSGLPVSRALGGKSSRRGEHGGREKEGRSPRSRSRSPDHGPRRQAARRSSRSSDRASLISQRLRDAQNDIDIKPSRPSANTAHQDHSSFSDYARSRVSALALRRYDYKSTVDLKADKFAKQRRPPSPSRPLGREDQETLRHAATNLTSTSLISSHFHPENDRAEASGTIGSNSSASSIVNTNAHAPAVIAHARSTGQGPLSILKHQVPVPNSASQGPSSGATQQQGYFNRSGSVNVGSWAQGSNTDYVLPSSAPPMAMSGPGYGQPWRPYAERPAWLSPLPSTASLASATPQQTFSFNNVPYRSSHHDQYSLGTGAYPSQQQPWHSGQSFPPSFPAPAQDYQAWQSRTH